MATTSSSFLINTTTITQSSEPTAAQSESDKNLIER